MDIGKAVCNGAKAAWIFLGDHKKEIIMGSGIACLVATPFLGIVGGHKAERAITNDDRAMTKLEQQYRALHETEGFEHFKEQLRYRAMLLGYTWPYYIPSICSATAAGLCFGAVYHIQAKENIKLASACVAAETLVTQYQDQFVEPRNAQERKRNSEVNEKFFETAEKRYDADESKRGTEDDCYFFDSVTGISFWSSERNVLYAQSRVKEDLFDGSEYATIPDLYMYMGVDIDAIDGSIFREFGWTNKGALPDVKIDAVMRDGRPIAVLHYRATYLNDVLPMYPPHMDMTSFEKDIDKTNQYVEDYDPDKKE